MSRKDPALGVGLYSIPDACYLLGVPASKVRRWLGMTQSCDGVIQRSSCDPETVTFSELMELMFVRMFREEGVSLQTIRQAAITASQKFQSPHPFALKRFDTDGRTIFATMTKARTDEEVIEDLRKGQLVFKTIIKPFFKKIEYQDNHEAVRFWPLSTRGRIVLDPRRSFGQPIDSKTGVPIDAILSALNSQGVDNSQTVAEWLDIPVDAVQAAVQFQRQMAS